MPHPLVRRVHHIYITIITRAVSSSATIKRNHQAQPSSATIKRNHQAPRLAQPSRATKKLLTYAICLWPNTPTAPAQLAGLLGDTKMMHTIEQIVDDVCANHKSGKWLSCTYQTEYGSIGIKAYGKWVQRIECCGLCDGIPEQKTLKALRFELSNLLTSMISVL